MSVRSVHCFPIPVSSTLRNAQWRGFVLLLMMWNLCSCASRLEEVGEGMRYATLLDMEEHPEGTWVTVKNPWHAGQVVQRYLLTEQTAASLRDLPEHCQVVKVPVQRIAALSSVHAALFYELGAGNRVVGLADAEFVVSDTLRKSLASGRLKPLGSSMQPDAEQLAALKAEVLLQSPYQGAPPQTCERLPGVQSVCCADYMETSALGRAEWMRFYGRLVGCGEAADSIFRQVEAAYLATCEKVAAGGEPAPGLLCDRKQGASWPLPGGKSYLGKMFEDAGARYLFADQAHSGTVCLSPEEVYARASQADVWIVKYGGKNRLSLQEMKQDDAVSARFRPWQSGQVYACNTLKTPYYEEVPFHPDLLLADLAALFHPSLFPGHVFRYYFPVPSEGDSAERPHGNLHRLQP